MSMYPIFNAKVNKGKITLQDKSVFNQYIQTLEGKDVELHIRKPKIVRSQKENAYYWAAVIRPLSEFTGYTEEEMHEALKWKFLRVKERELLPTVRSTAALSVPEFEQYLERIKQWSAEELQFIIPDTDKVEIA